MLIPFRLLCVAQRASLVFFALGAVLYVAGQWFPMGGLAVGGVVCLGGVAIYGALALLQMMLERRLFFVSCPICGARSSSAAWTTSFQCDCPHCNRVYASGLFFLRFFSPRRASARAPGKDSL